MTAYRNTRFYLWLRQQLDGIAQSVAVGLHLDAEFPQIRVRQTEYKTRVVVAIRLELVRIQRLQIYHTAYAM